MDPALIKALGELLLNAVPTIITFLLLLAAYTFLVHRPLTHVLAERHSKTEGAIAKAQSDIAAADAKTAEYEQKLREARAEVFRQQDARRKQLMDSRSAALAEARSAAQTRVKGAKSEIERDVATAKPTLQGQSEALAQEVIESVLRGSAAPVAGAR
jgi:F-type H+-transporting ATPase subunit b